MRSIHKYIILATIFLFTFGMRLYIAFQTPYFSDDHSYLVLRQVDEIRETGLPLTADSLSYGGRVSLTLPLFGYILALPSLIWDPVLIGKVIPNLFASCIVLVVYLLVKHLTKDEEAALVSGFISGFLPVFFAETSNAISAQSIMIPITFLLIHMLLTLEVPGRLHIFLLLLCISALISASIILFVLAMMMYMIFLWVEGLTPSRKETELTVFSVFLVLWFYILYYKDALLAHGIGIFWQNIPTEVFSQYFADLTIRQVLTSVGAIPLVCGVIVIFSYTFLRRDRNMYLIIGLVLILTVLLLLQWIDLTLGLSYLGVSLCVLFSMFYVQGFGYLTKTKFAGYKYLLMAFVLILLVPTILYPAYSQAQTAVARTTNNDHVRALELLSNITEGDSLIVATVFEGHTINYYAKRKNMVDTNFVGITDVQERLEDTRIIFTSAIESKPAEIMAKYGADYIYFTDVTKNYYNITKIAYADGECFPLFFSGRGVTVFLRKC